MAKKHKHEEHSNHEAWVISYADMVTLLFALFVVLYALGEVKLKKLKELKQSLAFAFSFEGSGKTDDEGVFDRGESGGVIIEGIPLLNSQRGEMIEYLLDQLPEEFEEITGKSLEVVLTDDTVSFTGSLATFFPRAGQRRETILKRDVEDWLKKLVENSVSFSSHIRVLIRAPRIRLRTGADGAQFYASDLCNLRLRALHKLLPLLRRVTEEMITLEFETMTRSDYAGKSGTWEDQATIAFAFANKT